MHAQGRAGLEADVRTRAVEEQDSDKRPGYPGTLTKKFNRRFVLLMADEPQSRGNDRGLPPPNTKSEVDGVNPRPNSVTEGKSKAGQYCQRGYNKNQTPCRHAGRE